LPGEPLWVAFAYADGYCNGDAYCYRCAKVYSFTTAASHTARATVEVTIQQRWPPRQTEPRR